MREIDFSEAQKQHLVRTIRGNWAFVPPPLPPEINYGKLAFDLATTSQFIGELNGAARRVPNTRMLISPLIRREALITSAIEGTITTIDNMLIQAVTPASQQDENAREANNYITALSTAEEMLQQLPISHRVIKAAHRTLLSGLSPTRGAGKRPGEYKIDQNAIGKAGDSEETAKYVPPPPRETQVCMDQLEAYINMEPRHQGGSLIDIAMMHYQFEAIHPFADGNGRIGRLLVTIMAMQRGLTQHPLLHISGSIEKDDRKSEYIERLYRVSTKGEWDEWITFFLQIVSDSCKEAIQLADEQLELQSEMKRIAIKENANPRAMTIIDSLFIEPYITASKAAELCKVSFPTAKADLQYLALVGILRPRMIDLKTTIYVAESIWKLGGRKLAR